MITGDGRSTLFCQPKDLEREIWDGYRLGPDAAPQTLGVDAAFAVGELAMTLRTAVSKTGAAFAPPSSAESNAAARARTSASVLGTELRFQELKLKSTATPEGFTTTDCAEKLPCVRP